YLIEEHAAQYQEIEYWLDIAKGIQDRYGKRIPFYCDSARPEYVKRFYKEGKNSIKADKARLSGVEAVARRFKTNKSYICKYRVCRFRDEIYQYVWDEKTGEPVKKDDDVMDCMRYAIYTQQVKRGNVAKVTSAPSWLR